MDDRRFDDLVKRLSNVSSRRGAARLLAGATLGAMYARAAATGLGAQGGGDATCRGTHDQCSGDGVCCSGRCDGGLCRCRERGDCAHDRACCSGRCRADGTCKRASDPDPDCAGGASSACLALGQRCNVSGGRPCCTDAAPDAQCAGGLNPETTCQDCNRAPTKKGAFCKKPPGNQCCGGFAHCASGVKVQDGTAVCWQPLLGGFCRPADAPCTHDYAPPGSCPAGGTCCPETRAMCIRIEPGGPCCSLLQSTTACALPCPLPQPQALGDA